MKPLILALILQFFLQFSAIMAWRPYIIQILNAYAIRWNASYTAVVMSSMGLGAKICSMSLIKTMGKRRLYLAASTVTYICCFGLSQFKSPSAMPYNLMNFYRFCIGAIGFLSFPVGRSSFHLHATNATNATESSANLFAEQQSIGNFSHFSLVLILILQFAESVGLTNVSFVMMAEIFPFK